MGAVADAPPAEGRSSEEEDLAKAAKAADANGGAASPEGAGEGEELEGEGEEAAPEQPKMPPVELEGSGSQLTLKITGQAPDKGTAKLQGGKMDIPKGEYQPGDVVEAVVRMRCVEVSVTDKMNNTTGAVNERERTHKFKVMGIEKISA